MLEIMIQVVMILGEWDLGRGEPEASRLARDKYAIQTEVK